MLGRYELLRPLARGGMAEVYLARRRVAGVEKRLVIKRLRRERIADPRFLDLFVKEAQLSMTLVQQNIVPVFDFGRIGDDVFLAMEHIDGRDLGSTLSRSRGSGMPPLIAAFIASECCHALHHAHSGAGNGGICVVHRDVTPRNILLSWSGEVKLADFGIASAMGIEDSTLIGTPGYMAPEQARGESLDGRADLYALGLVLWEMLTGAHVRHGGDPKSLFAAAQRAELPPIPDGLPDELTEVIARATDGDQERRLASARSMSDQLDSFMVGARAREGGAAPAQQLAGWLLGRWADASDSMLEFSDREDGRMVTFLDDGSARVLGSGTLRSMAATAAPSPPSADATQRDEELAAASETRATEDPVAMKVAAASIGSPAGGAVRNPPPRSWVALAQRRAVALLAVAVAAGVGSVALDRVLVDDPVAPRSVIVAANPSPSNPSSPSPPDGAALVPDRSATTAAAAPTRPPDRAAPVAPVVAAKPRSPRSSGGQRSVEIPAAVIETVAPPAARATREFTIGARPWAHFTIDDDARIYETPSTLMLALGTHRLRFVNPTLGIVQEVTISVRAEGPASYLHILQ